MVYTLVTRSISFDKGTHVIKNDALFGQQETGTVLVRNNVRYFIPAKYKSTPNGFVATVDEKAIAELIEELEQS